MKRGQTVLLVEDDSYLRKFMSLSLKDNGYLVLETHNGKDAMEIAGRQHGPIHALVTDVILAGPMDGLELGAAMRKLRPGLRVLYVSGYSLDWDGRWQAEIGNEFFLAKPFSAKGLIEAMSFCLSAPSGVTST